MKHARFASYLITAAAFLILPFACAKRTSVGSQSSGVAGVDSAFEHFWAADSPAEAAQTAVEIEKTGITFDDAIRRLRLGRNYAPQATGVIQLMNRTQDGIEHFFAVKIQ